MIFPELNTTRLRLRELTSADAEIIFQLRSDPEVNKYLDRTSAGHIMDAVSHIERVSSFYKEGKAVNWVMEEKDTATPVGTICIWNINMESLEGELGYELLPKYQRKGLMKEAIDAVLDWAFKQYKFQKLFAWTHNQNLASSTLLSRSNFTRDEEEENKQNKEDLGPCVIFSRNAN